MINAISEAHCITLFVQISHKFAAVADSDVQRSVFQSADKDEGSA
jgi:hypothetical protein